MRDAPKIAPGKHAVKRLLFRSPWLTPFVQFHARASSCSPQQANASNEVDARGRLVVALGEGGRLAQSTVPGHADVGRDFPGELVAQARSKLEIRKAAAQLQLRNALQLKSHVNAWLQDETDLAPWPALILKLGSVEQETDDEEEPV